MNLNISKNLCINIERQSDDESVNYKIERFDNKIFASKKNKAVHSKQNVERECKNLLSSLEIASNKNVLIFYGFGLGYPLLHLANNFNTYFPNQKKEDIQIVVVVNDVFLFKYCYKNIDISILSSLNIFFLYYTESPKSVFNFLNINFIQGIKLIILPSLSREEKTLANIFYRSILTELENKFSDLLTNMNFESLWTRNIIFNSKHISTTASISVFKNAFKNLSVVLVAAGPTLQKSIDSLKEHRTDIFIIAAATAYPVLIKNNITPDFVFTSDAGFYNIFDFVCEKAMFPYIIIDIMAHHSILDILNGRANIVMFCSNKLDIINTLEAKLNLEITNLFMVNTVASAMIDLASYMGFDSAIMIGFDNSYPYYYRHAKHSYSYENYLSKIDRLHTLESYHFDAINARANLQCYPPVDFIFENQKKYFETVSEKYKQMKILRFTSDAIKIKNIEEGTILDIKKCDAHRESLDIARKCYSKNNNIDIHIINAYKEMLSSIEAFKNDINILYEKALEQKSSAHCIEDIFVKSNETIEKYKQKISILKTALSVAHTMTTRSNQDTLIKTLFLLDQAIKNANYFHTRILMLLKNMNKG